jgi:3-hydroxybutyryl-CoA dehydratase
LTGLYFQDFKIDDEFETSSRTITEMLVTNFAALSGDYNPLHSDEEFAKAGPFGKRIGHGVLTLAVLTGLLDKLGITSYTAEAFYSIDSLRFTKPVYFGDSLQAKVKVIDKQEREHNGLVAFENKVTNQNGELVLICKTKLLIKKK